MSLFPLIGYPFASLFCPGFTWKGRSGIELVFVCLFVFLLLQRIPTYVQCNPLICDVIFFYGGRMEVPVYTGSP